MEARKLKAAIALAGSTITKVSAAVGLSRGGFYVKMKNESFTQKEIRGIAKAISLSEDQVLDIFFAE